MTSVASGNRELHPASAPVEAAVRRELRVGGAASGRGDPSVGVVVVAPRVPSTAPVAVSRALIDRAASGQGADQ